MKKRKVKKTKKIQISVVVSVLALVAAFGQWWFPREPVQVPNQFSDIQATQEAISTLVYPAIQELQETVVAIQEQPSYKIPRTPIVVKEFATIFVKVPPIDVFDEPNGSPIGIIQESIKPILIFEKEPLVTETGKWTRIAYVNKDDIMQGWIRLDDNVRIYYHSAIQLTPTPTATIAPTPTLTPTPQQHISRILLNTWVSVFESPTGDKHAAVSTLKSGTQVYICAAAGDRYLIALKPCHSAEPVGWMKQQYISPPIPPLTEYMITPLPPTPHAEETPTPTS